MKEYCSALTKEDCRRQSGSFIACDKVSSGVVVSLVGRFYLDDYAPTMLVDINLRMPFLFEDCRTIGLLVYIEFN